MRNDIERLRALDPADVDRLPDPDSLQARALFQEIIMSTPTSEAPVESRRPRFAALVAAAGAVAVVAVAAVALTLNGAPAPDDVAADDPVLSGGGMAMCIAYSDDLLAERAIAFDGVLQEVDGDNMTFTVNEAFRGVDSDTITLPGAGVIVGDTTMAGGPSLAVGDRALIAGETDAAWACGFSQRYDEAVAAHWRTIFG